MDETIAICMPTYRRSEVVDEFFREQGEFLNKQGIVVHIYDSSEDSATEKVVEFWCNTLNNVRYTRIDASVHSNAKVYQIFQLQGKSKEFNYIWVYSDSIRWSEEAVPRIKEQLPYRYDMIVPNYRDKENIGDKAYTDINQFFQECGWHLTLYGAALLNTETMLQNVPWETLSEKYLIPDRINNSHVAFYFEKIAMLDSFTAIHLTFQNSALTVTQLRKRSGWWEEAFHLWGYCWPKTILALPDIYKDKRKMIKKEGLYSGVFTWEVLYGMKLEGLYHHKVFWKYLKVWHNLSYLNLFQLWKLSVTPAILYKLSKHYKLLFFVLRYRRIYIYGAGLVAIRVVEYLDLIHKKYQGFLVTKANENLQAFKDHTVSVLTDEIVQDKSAGIILGLGKENTKEVLPTLINKGIGKRLYIFSKLN